MPFGSIGDSELFHSFDMYLILIIVLLYNFTCAIYRISIISIVVLIID